MWTVGFAQVFNGDHSEVSVPGNPRPARLDSLNSIAVIFSFVSRVIETQAKNRGHKSTESNPNIGQSVINQIELDQEGRSSDDLDIGRRQPTNWRCAKHSAQGQEQSNRNRQ